MILDYVDRTEHKFITNFLLIYDVKNSSLSVVNNYGGDYFWMPGEVHPYSNYAIMEMMYASEAVNEALNDASGRDSRIFKTLTLSDED